MTQGMAGDTKQVRSLGSLRRELSRVGRPPWWWAVGASLVLLVAILLGDAVQADHHRGLTLKSLAVGLGVILVGNAILAVAVVGAERRRGQRKDAAPQPGGGYLTPVDCRVPLRSASLGLVLPGRGIADAELGRWQDAFA